MINSRRVEEVLQLSQSKLVNGVYNGVVLDNQDPKLIGRIKVSIPQVTEGIVVGDLPWYSGEHSFMSSPNAQMHVPTVGSQVVIRFPTDDIYNGLYSFILVSEPPR